MKKPVKILYIVCTAILVIVVVALIAIGLFANSALKVAIESAGTKALNVGVSVKAVDLSILRGRLGIENLTINNPPGYKHEKLLELSQADIKVNTKSLLSDVVNIEDIKLDGAKVVLEQRGVSGNNLQDIIKTLPKKEAEPSEPSGKKLHINNLEITNAEVKVKLLPVPGKVDTIPLKLDTIKLTDLGNDNNLDAVALTRTVLIAIAGGIVKQGADILPGEMLGDLVNELKNIGTLPGVLIDTGVDILETGTDIGKEATKTGKDAGEGIIKGVEDTGKGITKGLKDILKQEKEE
jgi:hypothetical protein